MSGINVGIKKPAFPKWVDEIYAEMSDVDRETNVKANIYGLCRKTRRKSLAGNYVKGFRIHPMISALSNRVSFLDSTKSVAVAISLADSIYPWTFYPGDQEQLYKCKHCKTQFKTRERQPQCKKCKKWDFQEEEGGKKGKV